MRFSSTVVANRGNSCELKPRKKRSCLASVSRFISVFASFLNVQIWDDFF